MYTTEKLDVDWSRKEYEPHFFFSCVNYGYGPVPFWGVDGGVRGLQPQTPKSTGP